MSPAKSRAQLKRAYAGCARGEKWACDMVKHTPRATRSRLMKRGPERAKKSK